MTVTQEKLLTVLRAKVQEFDEGTRIPGYRQRLIEALAQIVLLERENLEAGTQIQKKVTDQTQALGRLLSDSGWRPE